MKQFFIKAWEFSWTRPLSPVLSAHWLKPLVGVNKAAFQRLREEDGDFRL